VAAAATLGGASKPSQASSASATLQAVKGRIMQGKYATAASAFAARGPAVRAGAGTASWVTLRARWVTLRARWETLRARWVTRRARWVTLRARWETLRARWVTLRARWVTQRAH
jgi:hypothetical protein